MDIASINQLLTSRLNTLNDARARAISVGDIDQINIIDKDLMETKNSLQQLIMLAKIAAAANNANTTPADVIASGIDAVSNTNTIQGPSSSAFINGYDISAYATDPLYEQKVQTIINGMPSLIIIPDINNYIQNVSPGSPISGEMVIAAAAQYLVDIPLLVAIMQNDSQFGTEGVGARTNNPGNVGNTGTAERMYGSWAEGVLAVAEWLDQHRVAGATPVQIPPSPVIEPILTSVTVIPTTANITAGNTQQLITNMLDQNGAVLSGASITFSSNDTAVAIVNNMGIVTANSPGTATITALATLNNQTATGNSTITVSSSIVEPVLSSITITPTVTNILAGATQQLTANPLDHNGNLVSGASITFKSDNTSIATVDNTGIVTANSPGTATITAQATFNGNTVNANSIVSVSNPAPVLVLTSVAVTPVTASVTVGATQQLTASSLDQNGNIFNNAIITFSSDNASVATVDNSGMVTAISAGTANITVQAVFADTTVTGRSTIIVNNPETLIPADAPVSMISRQTRRRRI